MPKRVFTPAAIQTIRELAAQEKTAAEIAGLLGSTAASVRVKCCHLKIHLSRRGRPTLVPALPAQAERETLVIHMHPAKYAALKLRAAHMRKPIGELATMLLQAIISSNIYEAVLDEDG
jgi:hypothetical protein